MAHEPLVDAVFWRQEIPFAFVIFLSCVDNKFNQKTPLRDVECGSAKEMATDNPP
jgi:hypothetical protein